YAGHKMCRRVAIVVQFVLERAVGSLEQEHSHDKDEEMCATVAKHRSYAALPLQRCARNNSGRRDGCSKVLRELCASRCPGADGHDLSTRLQARWGSAKRQQRVSERGSLADNRRS